MQQLDPLGSGGSWDVALLMSLATWAYVAFEAQSDLRWVQSPTLTLVSLALFTLAIGAHLWASAPRHAPYLRYWHVIVGVLLAAGGVAQIYSVAGSTTSLNNDWGIYVVALMLASISVFRPVSEVQLMGLFVVVSLGVALALDSVSSEHPFGIPYYVFAGVTPVIIVVLGQASYTTKATSVMMSWRSSLEKLRDSQAISRRSSIALSVGSQLAEEFEVETKPLLVGILDSGRVTAADSETARQLAQSIRSRLLEVSSQSWLERTGAQVVDPEDRIEEFSPSARAAVIALITGLASSGVDLPRVSLQPDQGTRQIVVEAVWKTLESGTRMRPTLAPYLRVMYLLFDDVRVSYRGGQVTLKFQYGDK